MKQFFLLIGLCIFFINCDNRSDSDNNTMIEEEEFPLVVERRDKTKDDRKIEFVIKERLGKPFGTFIKLKVEIFDGDSLHTKSSEGIYLLKVISVDDKILPKPIIMEFRDQCGKFPTDDFELSGYLEKIKNGEISKNGLNENIDTYVGSKYDVVGYESGEFSGLPYGGNYEFSQAHCGKEFHFRNYIIVLADLTKKK